jgi:hypothetical protein
MRGQLVVCRDFMGELLVRKVWEDSARLVFVHTDDQFIAHEQGRPHLDPVGFPRGDVFVHDSEALASPDASRLLKRYE